MLSALEANKIAIEAKLDCDELDKLNEILLRIEQECLDGEDTLEYECVCSLDENVEWALNKLGYNCEFTDLSAFCRYTILW